MSKREDSSCELSATYVVYPEDGSNVGQTKVIRASLNDLAGNASAVFESSTQTLGISYWTLSLTPSQAAKVSNMTNASLSWSLSSPSIAPKEQY